MGSIDANEDRCAVLIGRSRFQVYWYKDNARVDSVVRNTMQEAGGSVCSFPLECRVLERPLSAMAARLWL